MAEKNVKITLSTVDKTKRGIDKAKSSLGGLKKAALAVSAALATVGAGRALNSLVNLGKEMESLQIRFKLLFTPNCTILQDKKHRKYTMGKKMYKLFDVILRNNFYLYFCLHLRMKIDFHFKST